MEVIRYEAPESWDDKGMDWNAPDPANADYAMAIRQAVLERCAALRAAPDRRVLAVSPWKAVSRTAVAGLADAVARLAPSFVNLEWEEFADDYSDFPRMWTYGDLIQDPGCRLCEFAPYGSLREGGGEWLRRIRNALDRLTVVRAGTVYGVAYARNGSRHDPPFGEAIGDAMDEAMKRKAESVLNGRFPTSAFAWSGNTHWRCPDPEGDADDEDNVDGYCGYAQSRAYRITAARSWLLGAKFDVFAAVVATRPTGPAPYSAQLDTSTFDAGESGLKEGLNWTGRVRADDPYAFVLDIGHADSIPQNGTVPQSEFDGEGNPVRRHSAKRGWEAAVHGFLDYGVEGGFKFRGKEE